MGGQQKCLGKSTDVLTNYEEGFFFFFPLTDFFWGVHSDSEAYTSHSAQAQRGPAAHCIAALEIMNCPVFPLLAKCIHNHSFQPNDEEANTMTNVIFLVCHRYCLYSYC